MNGSPFTVILAYAMYHSLYGKVDKTDGIWAQLFRIIDDFGYLVGCLGNDCNGKSLASRTQRITGEIRQP